MGTIRPRTEWAPQTISMPTPQRRSPSSAWGYRAFAGQRDDGFYADIQGDLRPAGLPHAEQGGFDSQGGFNVHTIALEIPLDEIGGPLRWPASTRRPAVARTTILRSSDDPTRVGRFVQVGVRGTRSSPRGSWPWSTRTSTNRTSPKRDEDLFDDYALEPELAGAVNFFLFDNEPVVQTENRET